MMTPCVLGALVFIGVPLVRGAPRLDGQLDVLSSSAGATRAGTAPRACPLLPCGARLTAACAGTGIASAPDGCSGPPFITYHLFANGKCNAGSGKFCLHYGGVCSYNATVTAPGEAHLAVWANNSGCIGAPYARDTGIVHVGICRPTQGYSVKFEITGPEHLDEFVFGGFRPAPPASCSRVPSIALQYLADGQCNNGTAVCRFINVSAESCSIKSTVADGEFTIVGLWNSAGCKGAPTFPGSVFSGGKYPLDVCLVAAEHTATKLMVTGPGPQVTQTTYPPSTAAGLLSLPWQLANHEAEILGDAKTQLVY